MPGLSHPWVSESLIWLAAVDRPYVRTIEKGMIVKCMKHYGGNLTRVAEALGLSRAALYRRLEKYGLSADT